MRVVTLNEYADLPRTQVDWIVEHLIPRPGLVMLMGPEKAGKSFLALDVAKCAASGESVFGYACKQDNRVLYLQFDTSETIWRDRIRKLRDAGYNTTPSNLVMVHPEDQLIPWNICSANGQKWLKDVLDTANPDLVIIDVLREIHGKDENDSTAMKEVGDALIRAFTGRAVLLVHHTKKLSSDMSFDVNIGALSRGSSYITGKVDAYWLLHDGRLKIVNRFDAGRTLRAIQLDSGIWAFPELERDEDNKKIILTLCQDNRHLHHNQLAAVALEKHQISRSVYYRLIEHLDCAHKHPIQSVECKDGVP